MPKQLRIAVDMAATAGQKSGLGWYVEQVTTALEHIPGNHALVKIDTVRTDLSTPQRILWDQVGLPCVAAMRRPDLLWVPAFSAPKFYRPIVMTAHDIFGVRYPERFSFPARWYWSRLLPHSFKRARHLLCVSEYTKRDIVERLDIPESRCTVVPLAAGSHFRMVKDQQRIEASLAELRLTKPFILSVGTIEPRKNFARLIEAFATSQRNTDVQLVLVGKKGWETEDVYEMIRRYHLESVVRIVDYVSQEQLVALYNACLFFIMPSLFEGFGLPALEAMQCGAPVIVSQNTSLPEVVGDAGILCDPLSVDSLREKIDLLLQDDARRQMMRDASLARASTFSWEKTAQDTLAVFKRVMMEL